MERFEERRTVQAAIDRCWSVLTEPDHVADWLTVASEVRGEGDLGLGHVLHGRGSALGVTVEVTQTVHVWDPPIAYGWRGDDPIDVTFHCSLAELHPTTTALHATVEAAVSNSVGARVAVRFLRRQFTRSVDRLAELAERRLAV